MPSVAKSASNAISPFDTNPPGPQAKFNKSQYQINIDYIAMIIGAAWTIYATVAIIFVSYNPNTDPANPSCTVSGGHLHLWLGHMSYIMFVYGFFGLVVSGCVPKVFAAAQLKDEAICCSDVCQGMCGKATRAMLFVAILFGNCLGLMRIVQAYNAGVQYQYPGLKKSYCTKSFFQMSVVTCATVFTVILIMLILTIHQCFRAMRYDQQLSKHKFGPKGEDIARELGLAKSQQKGRQKKAKKQLARKKIKVFKKSRRR